MSAFGDFLSYVTTAEHWWGTRGIVGRAVAHVEVSVVGTAVAAVLALPPALLLGHRRRGGVVAGALINVGRAVPSFAVVALVLPFSLRYGFGLGFWPTAVAMVALALPPIFTNAYAGIVGVDPAAVEAARGMGMAERDVLRRVELPIALPLVVTGLRLAAVQVVATATLGAYVGFRGLGSFIYEGFAEGGRRGDAKLLTGAVAVALLAILTEVAFGLLQRALTPWQSTKGTLRT